MARAYRADIDGLRAIAVMAVVVFHYFPTLAPGGFTGVDVFFVISGFLITGIIAGELDAGRFSYLAFYRRRVRRIVPALVVVIAATAAGGWFILRADEYAELGRHIAASALFVSNLLLWSEASYFDTAAHIKPLLHLWSLAVEEQFYIVWPVVLAAIWRWARPWCLLILAAVALASFAGCLVASSYTPTAAFYGPLTRIWELALGGILAIASSHRDGPPLGPPDLWAVIGLALVASGIAFVDAGSPYPGWRALLPVLGATCLIAAGPRALVNRWLLSNRLAVGIGLVSYPLYLWHWPLISLANASAAYDARFVLRGNVRLWLFAASLALAVATFLLVERPIRRRLRLAPSAALIACSLPLLLALGLGLNAADGLPFRAADSHPKARFLQYYARLHTKGLAAAYRSECDFYDWRDKTRKERIDPSCTAAGAKGTWLLWGDSHAQALSLGLRAILPDGVTLAQVATSGCRPVLGATPHATPANACDRSNAFAREAIARLKPQVLLIAQGGDHETEDWARVARFAKEAGVARVILIGPAPQWDLPLPQIVVKRFFDADPATVAIPIKEPTFRTDRALRERYGASPDLTYVSLLAGLCRDDVCRATIPGERRLDLIAVDQGHLSPDGSLFVGREVLAGPIHAALAPR